MPLKYCDWAAVLLHCRKMEKYEIMNKITPTPRYRVSIKNLNMLFL